MSDQERISLYNMNTIKQKSYGNKEKILIRGLLVIQYQILQTNITITTWQTVKKNYTWDPGS